MLFDLLMGQFSRTPRCHHRPFGHHHITVRQSRREMQALLNQDDREPARRFKPDNHILNLINDRRLNAFDR